MAYAERTAMSDAANRYLVLLDRIEEADGVGDFAQEMMDVGRDIDERVDGIMEAISYLKFMEKGAREEAARLELLARGRKKAAKDLEQFLLGELDRMRLQRVETVRRKVFVRNNVETIEWDGPPEAIPGDFQAITSTITLNKELAKAARKAGRLPDDDRFVVARTRSLIEK